MEKPKRRNKCPSCRGHSMQNSPKPVIADKVERWGTYCAEENWYVLALNRQTAVCKIFNSKTEKADAEIICALHNAALDVSPNLMAVAENIFDMYEHFKAIMIALENCGSKALEVRLAYNAAKPILAAFTKGKNEKADNTAQR